MLKTLKALLGHGLAAFGLHQWLIRDGAVIVTFHRVQPSDGSDSLTMPVREFGDYCRYFKDQFDVVTLREIVERLNSGRSLDHTLAITFDDGYRDNFEYAAPALDRLSLPATFFVVSEWIGTDVVAWWDRERGRLQDWMDWNQVRALHAQGFEIGSHTRTHADLGTVPDDVARRELLESRMRIEQELGAPVSSFAYPYGRRENMTSARERLVREAGYTCCCASYGGVNRPGADPFRLLRIPVAPESVSPHELTFDLAFDRTLLSA